jgi:hypothetical protein
MLGQIDDAFKMPFYDLNTRQQQRILNLAIIISGRFAENAIEKICEKIETTPFVTISSSLTAKRFRRWRSDLRSDPASSHSGVVRGGNGHRV